MSDVCPEWRGRERGVQYRSNWQSLTGSKSLLQPTEYRRDRISPVLPAFLPHLVAILHWQEFSWDNQGRAVTFQVKILSPVKTRNGPTQLIDYSHNLTQSYDLFLFQTQTSKYFVLGITSPPTHPCLWKFSYDKFMTSHEYIWLLSSMGQPGSSNYYICHFLKDSVEVNEIKQWDRNARG